MKEHNINKTIESMSYKGRQYVMMEIEVKEFSEVTIIIS